MNLEQMKKIVEGAPDWAESFNVYLAAYGSGGVACKGDIMLSDLRAEIAKQDPMDIEPSDIPHGCVVVEK